jgi:outer membrane receptor for ferrienterochelin and colicins
MNNRLPVPSERSLALLVLLLLCLSAGARAQTTTGTLSGKVKDSQSGEPLVGATVRVIGSDAATRRGGAITDRTGSFVITGLAPGTYRISVSYVSYSLPEEPSVTIRAGQTSTLDVTMSQTALGMNEVVVSASRRPEKITEAPASVSVVDARSVQEQPALTVIDHLKGVQGVDIVQAGLTQSNVVTRGFNNAFSGTLLTLTDNRMASVPSLRVNAYYFIPLVNEDVQQIELIRGPGSALYGPNTANGVLHVITRSPFSSSGTWVSLAGGERNVVQGMVRHAGTITDRIGYKISGQYMSGTDWVYTDTAEVTARETHIAEHPGINLDTLLIGRRDSTITRFGGEVRLDMIPTDDMTAILAAGFNQAGRNIDITGVGSAQVKDWRYSYYQARLLYKDLFFQAFLNQSNAGNNSDVFTVSPTERGTYLLRSGAPIVDNSTLFVTQLQHSYRFGEIERLTYGADLLLTTPQTEGTINGKNEDDDNITEFGIYLQSETDLVPDLLDLVVAGRFDKHSRVEDPIISPRAAIVFNPTEDHSLRLTYNRAYTAPTTNELFLDLVANESTLFNVRASGVPDEGFNFRFENGRPLMHSYAAFGNDPKTPIAIDNISSAWPALMANVKASAGIDLTTLAPPTSSQVGTELRVLNATTGAFDPTTIANISNRSPVKPTITSTIELGYKGILLGQIALDVDLYRSQYDNFVGPLEVITPNVFMNFAQLRDYLVPALIERGFDTLSANFRAIGIANALAGQPSDKDNTGAPIGTISPEEAANPADVMLTYRNYGKVTLYGYDIGVRFSVTNGLILNSAFSYVDRNFFANLDNVADLSLNAPKFKYSLGAEYRLSSIGFNSEIRYRHVDGFPVRSGVYIGDVPGYSAVDLTLGYQFPMVEGLGLTISAQNLLTFVEGDESDTSPFERRHAEFVGTASIGRLVLARLTYGFR